MVEESSQRHRCAATTSRARARDQVAPPLDRMIARARELLRTGEPVVRVASALGYCDQSQLHRHFLRIVGTTPGSHAHAQRGR